MAYPFPSDEDSYLYDEDIPPDLDEYGREKCIYCSFCAEECFCSQFVSNSLDYCQCDEQDNILTQEEGDEESMLSGVEYMFWLELYEVRERVEMKFEELITQIKARKKVFMDKLDKILANYFSYLKEVQLEEEKREKLEKTKVFLQEELEISNVRSIQENLVNVIEGELKSIKVPTEPKMVDFICDNNKMLEEINKFGCLIEKIDYASKIEPVTSICMEENGVKLSYPWGVAVDNGTNNIYVSDQCHHCVKVFDISGIYLFRFEDLDGGGKMEFPKDLLIHGGRLLVSHGNEFSECNHSLLNFHLDGTFISRIGRYGTGENEYNCPCGLACDDSNEDIYICDKRNNRIQVITKEFTFKSEFGSDILKNIRDVKLSRDHIFVLEDSDSDPCVHLYGFEYTLHHTVVFKDVGVCFPFCLLIDDSDNILISSSHSNSILVFNSQFQMFHQIESVLPRRMALDKDGRLIVTSLSPTGWIQIF